MITELQLMYIIIIIIIIIIITESNAPEDGQICCPKHVELIWIYE